MLSREDISKYNRFRKNTDTSVLCHAPFVNLNFDQYGNMTACCYNRVEILGRYPQDTILNAWQGSRASDFRRSIMEHNMEGGCAICMAQIRSGNYAGTKARFYDEYAKAGFWGRPRPVVPDGAVLPTVLELELSNTCNLECVMCSGAFSSTIRKNREQLPPLPMVYDAAFVEQLAALMPGLTDMKFLGGEPFLIDIYYDIWETILRVNPDIRVHITTNGTVLNERAKRILRQLKVGIVLSLDSIAPDTYAAIRRGGQLERVLQHFEFFKEITNSNNTYLSLAVCPMIQNWKEIPGLLRFATAQGCSIHFNTVVNPAAYSLNSLETAALREVVEWYTSQLPSRISLSALAMKNRAAFAGLTDNLKAKLQKSENDTETADMRRRVGEWLARTDFSEPEFEDAIFRMIMAGFIYFECPEWKADQRIIQHLPELQQAARYAISRDWMLEIIKEKGGVEFSVVFLRLLLLLDKLIYQQREDFHRKIQIIISMINATRYADNYAHDLLENTILRQLKIIDVDDESVLKKDFMSRYGSDIC
jgi:molybdenum cofactor biosynthesis enzyme MoaA